jgi:hypothetical protein
MRKLFICIMIFAAAKMYGQDIDWQQTSEWKLYDTHGIKSFDATPEKIQNFKSALLDSQMIKNFLSNVTKMIFADAPVWMGYHIASCITKDGKLKLFYISTYGGFFYDSEKKIYYQIREEARNGWLDYLSHAEAALQTAQ